MKREPVRGPKVFDEAEAAGEYATSAASRNQNLSKIFAGALMQAWCYLVHLASES